MAAFQASMVLLFVAVVLVIPTFALGAVRLGIAVHQYDLP